MSTSHIVKTDIIHPHPIRSVRPSFTIRHHSSTRILSMLSLDWTWRPPPIPQAVSGVKVVANRRRRRGQAMATLTLPFLVLLVSLMFLAGAEGKGQFSFFTFVLTAWRRPLDSSTPSPPTPPPYIVQTRDPPPFPSKPSVTATEYLTSFAKSIHPPSFRHLPPLYLPSQSPRLSRTDVTQAYRTPLSPRRTDNI